MPSPLNDPELEGLLDRATFADAYRGYFAFVNDPANRLRTMTLPFDGGLEITVGV